MVEAVAKVGCIRKVAILLCRFILRVAILLTLLQLFTFKTAKYLPSED